MTIVAVVGDVSTTTAVVVTAAWSHRRQALLVEADPAGGDLAAWLDMPAVPSLSTLVTSADRSWSAIEAHARTSPSSIRVITAPIGAAEARQAVSEGRRWIVPVLAGIAEPIVIADSGDVPATPDEHPFVAAAATVVLTHRQSTQSAPAAAARLRRLADQVELMAAWSDGLVVAVVGSRPFDIVEIGRLVGVHAEVVSLPVDPLSAAVYAGATGVSARRLARLPLSKAAARLVDVLDAAVGHPVDTVAGRAQ